MERKIIVMLSDLFSEYEYLLDKLTGTNYQNFKDIAYKR